MLVCMKCIFVFLRMFVNVIDELALVCAYVKEFI